MSAIINFTFLMKIRINYAAILDPDFPLVN